MSIILVVLLIVSMLGACGKSETTTGNTTGTATQAPQTSQNGSQNETQQSASEKKDFLVYLITMDLMDQHWVTMDQGARKAAEELGIKYKWTAPTTGKDDAAQIECINNAVADGADAILLASNGPTTQVATLEEASKAGVKIIYVDSPAEFPAIQTLATDNEKAGEIAGQEMLEALKAKGITSGKIGIVNVNSATTSTVLREQGFRKVFEGTDFEILPTQYGEGQVDKSQQIATNYITEGCVGIFGTNEGSSVGVGNAIQESGGDVVGVGFDKSDAILQLVNSGALLCTMAQNPYDMGYKGMQTAYAALTGGDTGPEYVDTGVSVIKKQ